MSQKLGKRRRKELAETEYDKRAAFARMESTSGDFRFEIACLGKNTVFNKYTTQELTKMYWAPFRRKI